MSELRKRSRDAGAKEDTDATETQDETSSQQQPPRKKLILVVAVLLTLLTFSLLLTRFEWHAVAAYLPWWNRHAGDSLGSEISYLLHPEDHVYRKPTTIRQTWRVTSGTRRPDGVLKRVYLINGKFPGPTLETRTGDRLVIKVENALKDENVSIHWHGLSMRGANDMDGAAGITNDPIAAGEMFTYDFKLENKQHGTFWYHAHDGVQRAEGLFGGLVVYKPQAWRGMRALDSERLLLIGDWYHRTAEEALDFYMHPGSFGNEPVPDSILVNGRGAYNCSDAVPARPLDCEQRTLSDLPALEMDRRRRNTIRVVNVGAYVGLGISIPSANLKVVATDGGNAVSAQSARAIQYLQPGERVDVQVEPSGTAALEQARLEVAMDTNTFKYPNPALTSMHTFPCAWTHQPLSPKKLSGKAVDVVELHKLRSTNKNMKLLPLKADETFVLYSITQRLAHLENAPKGFINNTSWQRQQSPPGPLRSLGRSDWDKNQFVPFIKYRPSKPLWVDIVLNNLDEESHPFHLHGYDFFVLSTYSSTWNWGSYNPFEDEKPPGGKYDLVRALKKDTVHVPRRGYAVLRFKADNPGIWMFHCHVLWHLASGMGMAFEVAAKP